MYTKENIVELMNKNSWRATTVQTSCGDVIVLCPGPESYKSACTVTICLLYYDNRLLKVCNSIAELVDYLNTIDYWIMVERYTNEYLADLKQRVDKDTYESLQYFLLKK